MKPDDLIKPRSSKCAFTTSWVVALAIAACGDDSAASGPREFDDDDKLTFDASAATVSYAEQVRPIFAAKCVACHHPGSPLMLDLQDPFDPELGIINRPNSYTEARNKVVVVPGKPEKSALIDKVAAKDLDHEKDGDPMPFVVEDVTADEIATIRTWIEDGAKNDTFYEEEVAPIFGDGVHLGRRIGKCSFCHTASSPFAPDLVNPFDSKRGVVNVAAGIGGVRVKPGDPDASVLFRKISEKPLPMELGAHMPRVFEPLTAAEIETLETWIREGALEN